MLGKHLLNRDERSGHIAKEQFCVRESHMAINQAIDKVLTFDITRQQKEEYTISTDAKSC